MFAHQLLLFRSQLAGLAQDLVRNRHFADVVQKSAARNDLDFLGRNPHGARQRDRVSRYPLGVPLGLRVFQVQGVAQRLQGHVVGVLQIFHRMAQHLRPGPHHLFQALVVILCLLKRLPVIQRSLDRA